MVIGDVLSREYDNINTGLDVLWDESALLTFVNVKSCTLQDEQRRNMNTSVENT